jgi:hypothetical protein
MSVQGSLQQSKAEIWANKNRLLQTFLAIKESFCGIFGILEIHLEMLNL